VLPVIFLVPLASQVGALVVGDDGRKEIFFRERHKWSVAPAKGAVGRFEKVEVTDIKVCRFAEHGKDKDLSATGVGLFAPFLNVIVNVKHGHGLTIAAVKLEQHDLLLIVVLGQVPVDFVFQ